MESVSTEQQLTNSNTPYEVFVSYAHDDEQIVMKVVGSLIAVGVTVRNPMMQAESAWGETISDYLNRIFPVQIPNAMIMLSENYASSKWCAAEMAAIIARAVENPEVACILPLRLDDSPVPDTLSEYVYIGIKDASPQEIARLARERIEQHCRRRESTLANLSDEDLMGRVGKYRDAEAFGLLYQRLYPRLLRMVIRRAPPEKLFADDIVQEVMIRLWEGADKYRSQTNVMTYANVLARFVILDRMRKAKIVEPLGFTDEYKSVPDPHTDVLSQLEVTDALSTALSQMSFAERNVISLYMEGRSDNEIAKLLHTSVQVIRTRRHRTLQRLRNTFKSTIRAT
jgi:RNA polymerase sigma factor (sigma-70 family)